MSIMLSKVWFQASKIMSFTEMSASPQRLVTCQQSSSTSRILNVQYPSSTSWPEWRMISMIFRYSYYTIILSILKLRLLIVRGWGNYQLCILLHSIGCNSTYTYSIRTCICKKGTLAISNPGFDFWDFKLSNLPDQSTQKTTVCEYDILAPTHHLYKHAVLRFVCRTSCLRFCCKTFRYIIQIGKVRTIKLQTISKTSESRLPREYRRLPETPNQKLQQYGSWPKFIRTALTTWQNSMK